MANIYTKQGDKGETGLYGGTRVHKSSRRVDVYGTVDEANSMLGLAFSLSEWDRVKRHIRDIQKKTFILAAEIASDESGRDKLTERITEKDTEDLEKLIDGCTEVIGKQTSFVIPGMNKASAALHVARTVVRRAERSLAELSRNEDVRDEIIRYVNRLSDGVYALARLEETMEEIKKRIEDKLDIRIHKLDLSGARKIAALGEKKADDMGVTVVISVVDSGGNMIIQERMDGAITASLDISLNKARTAFDFSMPTHELYDQAQPGGSLYGIENSNGGKVVVFGGGYPIKSEGVIIGAIGISGGTVEEDMKIGEYAVNEFLGGSK